MIEHTLLKPTATRTEILTLCDQAVAYGFYGVCVNPKWVPEAAARLAGTAQAVISVVGFPLGAASTDVKAIEGANAAAGGADELDMVADLGALKGKELVAFHSDVVAVVRAADGRPVKVIVEAGLLPGAYELALAASLAALAGAAFVKTSTGFAFDVTGETPRPLGATARDVAILAASAGPTVGVKAAGGISTYDRACEMVMAGASRIGTSSGPRLIGAEEEADGPC